MKDILAIQRELEALPEFARLQTIRQFSVSLSVFRGNAEAFRAHLASANMELWSVENRGGLEAFCLEVARHLHNFVAAAFSLVDHSRRFYNKNYKEAGTFTDYEEAVKSRFVEDPVCQFVQGLRNYFIHKEVPAVTATVQIDSGPPRQSFWISKSAILDGFGWKASAKEFMANLGEEIDLGDVSAQYEQKIVDFYDWVFGRLEEIHADDLKIVEAKKDEGRRALGANAHRSLEIALKIMDQINTDPAPMLLQLMDRVEWERIRRSGSSPRETAEAYIEEIEKYAPTIPDALRSRLIAAFERFSGDG